MKTTVHIISHSHWDREWYQSFETHRMKLIELVDNILDKAENDPEFGGFFLDGQVIAIDDYLEIRPEKRAQVEKCPLVRTADEAAPPRHGQRCKSPAKLDFY